MAYKMKSPLKKQKLSKKAAEDKAARDKAYMMGPYKKKKDYDHTKGKFVSVKANRGGYGKGTKK